MLHVSSRLPALCYVWVFRFRVVHLKLLPKHHGSFYCSSSSLALFGVRMHKNTGINNSDFRIIGILKFLITVLSFQMTDIRILLVISVCLLIFVCILKIKTKIGKIKKVYYLIKINKWQWLLLNARCYR